MRALTITILLLALDGCSSHADGLSSDDGGEPGTGGVGVSDGGLNLDEGGPGDLGPVAPACNVGAPSTPLTVKTDRGLIQGTQSGSTVAFLGVPYTEPPVGALRWAAPVDHACWTEVKQTTQYGSVCPQKDVTSGAAVGAEDCLFLNVWTPQLPSGSGPDAALPVLFFIHGGANILGASNQLSGSGPNPYDGAAIATRENAVVVTVNYRLGELGFMAHPALVAGNGLSGNYAILDLVQALHWVNHNVAAFGGDPKRVMVFGESAGGINTCMMLTTPLASGLFSSALMESGWCPSQPKTVAEQQGQAFALKVGCPANGNIADCLRAKSIADILAASPSFADLQSAGAALPVATVDGYAFPDSPLNLLSSGKHAKVPFAIGSNREEAAIFLATKTVNFCTDYENDMKTIFSGAAAQVLAQYPCSDYATPKAAETDVLTDTTFTCPARRIARAMAKTQSAPVYRYYYTHVSGGLGALLGAYHTAELPYVFGTFAAQSYTPTAAEVTLSQQMQDLWGHLAGSGDPNAGAPTPVAWPKYDAAADTVLVLDAPLSTMAAPKSTKCDFWDALLP